MADTSSQPSAGDRPLARAWRGRALVAPTPLFGFVTAVCLVFATVAALWLAPTESTMGDVQRLFYFHMPSAWIALGPAFTCVFAFSIAYLVKRDLRWDRYAAASAEIGVIFTTITLITGPLWAKPVWGVFWTWEPRLTTTLILWFIYVGYLLLRWVAPPGHKRARLVAVYGIVGWIDVPIVFLSIWWWRTVHPRVLGDGGFQIEGSMLWVLMFCLGTFTLLFVYLLFLRVRMMETSARLDTLEAAREEGDDL
jgi:heme exporter protein C